MTVSTMPAIFASNGGQLLAVLAASLARGVLVGAAQRCGRPRWRCPSARPRPAPCRRSRRRGRRRNVDGLVALRQPSQHPGDGAERPGDAARHDEQEARAAAKSPPAVTATTSHHALPYSRCERSASPRMNSTFALGDLADADGGVAVQRLGLPRREGGRLGVALLHPEITGFPTADHQSLKAPSKFSRLPRCCGWWRAFPAPTGRRRPARGCDRSGRPCARRRPRPPRDR